MKHGLYVGVRCMLGAAILLGLTMSGVRLATADEAVEEPTAGARQEPEIRRMDGRWYVSLPETADPDQRAEAWRKLAQAAEEIADEVEAGELRTIGATVRALRQRLIEQPTRVARGPRIPTRAFYTIDDGQTWFADDINKIPPFEHEGQEAVRAHIFTCDGGRTKFVAYLEKYTPQAKQRLEEMREKDQLADPMMFEDITMMGILLRKPGDPPDRWVSQMNWEQAARITEVRCPDGSTDNIQPVLPE